jgi:hypothetical protein
MITIIKQESNEINPLSRFVTVEAVALLLNIDAAKIKEIRLWRYLTLLGLKTLRFLKSPESELQRCCQITSTDSIEI